MMLALGQEQSTIYSGDASSQFKPAKPFKFKGLENIPIQN